MTLFGWRRVLVWISLIAAATLALAFAAERTLYFAQEEVSHTHAFDEWTSPFSPGSTADLAIVSNKLSETVEVLEPVALSGLALLVLVGLLVQKFDRTGRLDAWLTKAPPVSDRPVPVWNRDVPGPVLGLSAILGLGSFSVVALYIYYPAPKEAFAEIIASAQRPWLP